MAGNYPDVPSRRMAWDDDGAVCLRRLPTTGPNVEHTDAEMADLNDEDNVNVFRYAGVTNPDGGYLYAILPELRELEGVYVRGTSHNGAAANLIGQIATSGDTTNGIDGIWTGALADYDDSSGPSVIDTWRTEITSLALSSVRGVRVRINHLSGNEGWTRALHLYGRPSLGETPDRLLFIDQGTGAEFTKDKDYGDVPRGSTRDFQFRLRNNSGTLTANNVQITGEDLFNGSGAWYTFSSDGTNFQATLSITSIAPGADTVVLTCRQTIPVGTLPMAHAARIRATVASWS